MKRHGKLPFTLNVPFRAYQGEAFAAGVLKANVADFSTLLCDMFINCTHNHDEGNVYCLLDYDGWCVERGATSRQEMWLKPDILNRRSIDLMALNKEMLDNGHYINGSFNDYYIPRKSAYRQFDFNHDYLLLGYDDERGVFHSVGYLDDGKYDYFDIPYETYLESVKNISEASFFIAYRHPVETFVPVINPDVIESSLQSYLHSRNLGPVIHPDKSFGIAVWREYAQSLAAADPNEPIDLRAGRCFMEHKQLMLLRLRTLHEKGFLQNAELIDAYETLAQDAAWLFNLTFKYTLAPASAPLKKIHDHVAAINQREPDILEQVSDELSAGRR